MRELQARLEAGQEDAIRVEARAVARRRAADRRHESMRARPDRVAMWAFLMAIAITLAAAASSKAGSGGTSIEPDKPQGMKKAVATWYGPGLWGNRTACGQRLKRKTVGVAHRRLPCGTEVTIRYKGRVASAEVIDRGPFANSARWDLTQALAARLDFTQTDEIRTAVEEPTER